MAYDNSNKASLWRKKAFSGPVNIGDDAGFAVLVEVNSPKPDAPDYALYLHSMSKGIVSAPIYKKYAKGAKLAGGIVTWGGAEYWISVFPGAGMPDASGQVKNAKGPILDIRFQAKEQPAPAGPESGPTGDDIPF